MIYLPPKRTAMPQATRRAVARAAGATGIGRFPASCHWCGRKSWVYFVGLRLDHHVPFSKGGGHNPENVVLACQFCNCSRNNNRPLPKLRSETYRVTS
jgi:5-methylcytosine-specific restriction endonuclease McrA